MHGAGRWLLFGWLKPPLPLAALRGVGADPSPVPCACGTTRAMPAGPGQPIPKPPPPKGIILQLGCFSTGLETSHQREIPGS